MQWALVEFKAVQNISHAKGLVLCRMTFDLRQMCFNSIVCSKKMNANICLYFFPAAQPHFPLSPRLLIHQYYYMFLNLYYHHHREYLYQPLLWNDLYNVPVVQFHMQVLPEHFHHVSFYFTESYCSFGVFSHWKHAIESVNRHQASTAQHYAVTTNALEKTPVSRQGTV